MSDGNGMTFDECVALIENLDPTRSVQQIMSWEDWRSMGAEESTQGYLRLNEDRRRPLGQWLASIRMQEPERQCSAEDA